ncbi:B-cell receptor-associated protein 31 [Octopus sinensis]|nr:B-cell receptor-associated protein 31 [Octopus sinensis]
MSLQWTIIASFLYFEIGMVFLFLLPFISPLTWRKLFKSRLLSLISTYSYLYIRLLMLALAVAFLDSIWHLRKYNNAIDKLDTMTGVMPGVGQNQHLNLFRAQRNFYISGFSLFLWMVLNRIVKLITTQAQLQTDLEATHKQAVSATEAANRLMNSSAPPGENQANSEKENAAKHLQALKAKLGTAEEELQNAKGELKQNQIDLMAMKSQSEATKREYDRLLEEYSVLQKKTDKDSNKKDD